MYKHVNLSNESDLQEWTNGVLRKLDIHFVHIPAGNKRVRKGILDLMCWKNAKSFIVELKDKYKKPTPEQLKEIEAFKHQKIPVYVARTPDEVMEILKKYI